MEELYRFEDVRFKEVLHLPSLVFPKGGVISLFGPSGGGKTTLLRLLNKLLSPTKGRIFWQGKPLEETDSIALRRQVCLLSQTPVLFEGNVRDNLTAGLRFQNRVLPGDAELGRLLRKLQLAKELDGPVTQFSGGEKQRLALGRLLLLQGEVYLLDEPSAALDEETAGAIVSMMADWAGQAGKTLIMVTHAAALARRYSNHIVYLEAGRVAKEETLA